MEDVSEDDGERDEQSGCTRSKFFFYSTSQRRLPHHSRMCYQTDALFQIPSVLAGGRERRRACALLLKGETMACADGIYFPFEISLALVGTLF